MEGFCDSKFWDSELSWNTTSPYFTPCFESVVWSLLPFYFLVIFGLSDIYSFKRSKLRRKSIRATFRILTTGKLVLTLTLVILNIIQIVQILLQGQTQPIHYLTLILEIIAYVIILILAFLIQYAMVASSGVQFLFWFISATANAILFRTAYVQYDSSKQSDNEHIIYLFRLIEFPIICVRFLLEWFTDSNLETTRMKWGKLSPTETSTFISRMLFLWYDKFAWHGYRRLLTTEDLWDVRPKDSSKVQSDIFEKLWTEEKIKAENGSKKSKPGIVRPLLRAYALMYGFGLTVRIIADLLAFVQPLMLRYLVAHISNPEIEPAWKGYLYAATICSAAILQSILNGIAGSQAHLTSMHVRSALSNAVFRKALVVSNSAKKEASGGEIVNLMSVDTQRFLELLPTVGSTIGAPFQIVISIALLYDVLGPSVFAGVAVLFTLVPLNLYVVALSRKYQMQQMKLKDERLKLTSEVLAGIKVLKLYAWELAYLSKIEALRNAEIVYLRKIAYLSILTGFIFQCCPVFVSLASFSSYVLSDPVNNILNAERAFVSIGLFAIMRFPMILIPLTLSTGMQSAVSIERLNNFLNMEELDRYAVTHDNTEGDPVVIEDATLSWTHHTPTLTNINLSVRKGELLAIVGPIGSGKTSLLASLVGDLIKRSGRINMKGNTAYVSQTAWIQNASICDNILFGGNFKEARYRNTVSACALEADFQILSFGDQTEIGEKGLNLSGGQKQRVSLARAAYREADIYLFDDPLSAVDANVGKHIFENLIGPNGILRNKTRLFVTHGIGFLPRVDRIVVMKDGRISETGTYKELLMKQGEFAEFLLQHIGVDDDESIELEKSLIRDLEEVIGAETVKRRSSANRDSFIKLLNKNKLKDGPKKLGEMDTVKSKKMIVEEISVEGNISLDVIIQYVVAAGVLVTTLGFGGTIISNAILAVSNIWLSHWSTQATLDEAELGINRPETTAKYLLEYALIGGSLSFTTATGSFGLTIMCLVAGQVFHSRALQRILRSPMSYFDTTLLGRLINRFSKDVDTLDNLKLTFRSFLFIFFNVIATFGIMVYTSPLLLSLVIPVAVLFFFVQRFNSVTSRQLKRMDGVTRSPIYSHFGEAISGSSTVRAFRMEDEFITESEKRIDLNQRAYFPFACSSVWIALRLELIGILVVLVTCCFTLIRRGTITPGDAGLVLSYVLQTTLLLSILAKHTSDFETSIVSAERLGELAIAPQEPLWEIEKTKPKSDWPTHGEIQFLNYTTRYREGLDLVLKGISCTFHAGEKIGVVGRTGAGKSSLTLAIFRLIECSSGKIMIDGVDISNLGLHQLRQRITIIPQDPVLFSGTLRSNLDPSNLNSDDQIWKCLELAHLQTYARTFPEGLDYKIEEDGKNFSVGQRQLLCLTRALLRKTKILILDEATAAVDLETDNLIQTTIRHEFENATVVTIAHRLNTIMDSDRVLVLDQGQIKEFDSPAKLLQDSNSNFWKMARDAKLV